MADEGIKIEVKWKDTILLLVGTVLSFADPITDIITLAEFYRKGHKTWFGVGLTFVILPSLMFSILYWWQFTMAKFTDIAKLVACACCNPFSVALARLRAFLLCLRNFKKLWRGDQLEAGTQSQIKDLMYYATWSGIFEAVLESSPQFIIQLYAMSVQQEKISLIQVISVIISFLSLAWTFIIADEWRLLTVLSLRERRRVEVDISIKVKILLYVSQLFHLSSRLLAITYFTVAFKWWIIMIVTIHSFVMLSTRFIVDVCNRTGCGALCGNCFTIPAALCLYWIRDDGSAGKSVQEKDKTLKIILLVSNILFVVENILMVYLYYSNTKPHTWYSLPITVCVCIFSVVAAVMRIRLYRFLL